MKIIVGLGNPGKEYENTRHNMGFMAIDNYLNKKNIEINKEKFGGLYTKTKIYDEEVIFLKPQKYINLSGEVLKKFVDYYKIKIDDILVINDDLDIPFGNYKLKYKGSSGGHNGLKNIEASLGSLNYKRIKLGISNNKDVDTRDYVLGKLSLNDKKILKDILSITEKMIDDYFKLSFENLMNKYN